MIGDPGLNTISPTNKLLGLSYVNAINECTYLINMKKVSRCRNKLLMFNTRYLFGYPLVDRYGISVSQMTTDMFHLS